MDTSGTKSFIIVQNTDTIIVMRIPTVETNTNQPVSMKNGQNEPLTMTMEGTATATLTSASIGSIPISSNAPMNSSDGRGGMWS